MSQHTSQTIAEVPDEKNQLQVIKSADIFNEAKYKTQVERMLRSNQQYEVNLKDDEPPKADSPKVVPLHEKLKQRKVAKADSTTMLDDSPDELGFYSTTYSPDKELQQMKALHMSKYSKVPIKQKDGRTSELSQKQEKGEEYQTNVSSTAYGGLSYIQKNNYLSN